MACQVVVSISPFEPVIPRIARQNVDAGISEEAVIPIAAFKPVISIAAPDPVVTPQPQDLVGLIRTPDLIVVLCADQVFNGVQFIP